jgi:tRNA threonylcarbamoyl adenosine modification protein YeaZ
VNFVAFDTSNEYLTVIVSKDGKTHCEYLQDLGLQHSVTLLKTLEKALDEIQLKISDVNVFATVVGPGSFTGIRIGISTAKGLCAPSGAKALAITSFETMAYAVGDGSYLSVIDAKHDNFYVAGFKNRVQTLSPRFISRAELDEISGYELISATKIDGLETTVVDVSRGLYSAVVEKLEFADEADALAPLYLRQSQAEEGRK